MSGIRCVPVPLVNLKTSDNLQNLSTISEILNTFEELSTFNLLCEEDENSYYCEELINENGIYSPMKHIIQIKITVIQSSLLKLLNLENKAIVCRGMRHLLPIIMYGIFIKNTINGSKGNGNSGKDIFDEIFKNKFDFLNDKNSSIEKKLQEIKVSTMKNGETNIKLDEKPEQSKEEFAVTSCSIMKNIMIIVQLILPFIKNLDYFHNLYKINKVMTDEKYDRNLLLLFIFDELKSMYRTECHADVDAAALLQNRDGGWKFELNYDSIPLLVGEIDRLSVAMQEDLEMLFVKFYHANNPKEPLQISDVSVVFFHTINKYHDPEVWSLIGNEAIIVDHSSDSGETVPISIDKFASNVSKMIQGTTDSLTALVTKTVTCRCYTYLNLLKKLFYCSMRVLVVNAREVQRSIQELQEIKYNNNNLYDLVHNKIKELGTAECFNGDDVGAIDKLLDRDGGDEHFRNVYAVYWNRIADILNDAIDDVCEYLPDREIEVEYGPMVQETDKIQIQPKIEMKSVEFLFSRYKLGERAYKDHCFSGAEYDDNNVSTFSDDIKRALIVTMNNTGMRLTLEWIIKVTDTVHDELEYDLDLFSSKYFNE
ncbi:hypothetical protein ACI65C_008581 [Semiaphis heraclei]